MLVASIITLSVFSGVETLAAVVIRNVGTCSPLSGFLKTTFTITGGADVKKFTLAGNKLTFKATAFEARKDATYRVKIKATPDICNSKICLVLEIVYVSGKHNHLVCVFRRRNIIRGNTKCWYILPNATYRVKIKAALGTGISFFDWILLFPQTTEKTIVDWIPQTTEKTITVTVTKANLSRT
jgi:hypothetical protein